MSLPNQLKMESKMSGKVDHNYRRKAWIGIIIFLCLFWGGVALLIAHFF